MSVPADEYAQRLRRREAQAAESQRLHTRVGGARLLLAGATIVAAWWSLQGHAFAVYWLGIPVAAFAALVLYHFKVRSARVRAERAVAFYQAGLTRIDDRWAGTGTQGMRFTDPHHVYAADLDLFGHGGLFELLCGARTRMGEERLAQWLLTPATLEVIGERQASVVDLKDRLDLREELAVLGDNLDAGVHPDALLGWSEAPNQLGQAWIRWVGVVLPVLAVATAILWSVTGLQSPFFIILLIEAAVLYGVGKRIDQALRGTENAFDDLKLLAALLTRIESERWVAPALQTLIHRLSSHTATASRTIGRLATIANFSGSRRNQIVAVLTVPLMYTLHVAVAAERWRRLHGQVVRAWLDVTGEIEALLCLGAYSYEHPSDPFPEFVEGPAAFQGMGLGHPLIPAERCVRNDVAITGERRVLLVSGSNMSGKSTLLRTVGINTVLAMAGAPVRAQRLQLTPLQTGASIRINDSLHEGSSRFYAEIIRLRQLLDLTRGARPLLFLLDELLQGTNSRDRRTGAEGIVRAFVARGAIGLISTHDLALTDISGVDGAPLNVHFQDELENGRMKFDFKLRAGVVTKSNAVELMRSIGLEV